jgi:hypothetical protein
MSFAPLIKTSYQSHPAFQGGSSLNLKQGKSLLSDFNRAYQNLSQWPPQSLSDQNLNLQKAKKSLAQLFEILRIQASVEQEKIFLQELEAEISRLLEGDCGIFRRRSGMDVWTRVIFRKHKPYLAQLRNKRYFIDQLPAQVVRKILDLGGRSLGRVQEARTEWSSHPGRSQF